MNTKMITDEYEIYYKKLTGSLLYFTQIFFYLRTHRRFLLSNPIGRESHFITVCRALTDVFEGKIQKLRIHIPPRYAKTELAINFVAWALAQYPDSNFLYVSYSHSLAEKQTKTIKNIIELSEYRNLFNIRLKDDAKSKSDFELTANGSVYAAGAGGTITGRGAGINGVDRFGGAIIIDDIHKPDEATSDTIRERVLEWYDNTLMSRKNSPKTPIIYIGQRVHEGDLANYLHEQGGWVNVSLPALDEAGNALWPEKENEEYLRELMKNAPYVGAAQWQQCPQPAGGGIFKKEWFALEQYEPNIFHTFITIDTAETDKNYNDATVFSFWGVYKIKIKEIDTGMYGLFWLDCLQTRIEPKDLEDEFIDFYTTCMRHSVKPSEVIIEKKSTGTTLHSLLKKYKGFKLIGLERTAASGSKTQRFLDAQPYIAKGLIALPTYGKHTEMCIKHCIGITANNSHRFDDIADTAADAIKAMYVDKIIVKDLDRSNDHETIAKDLAMNFNQLEKIKSAAYRY